MRGLKGKDCMNDEALAGLGLGAPIVYKAMRK